MLSSVAKLEFIPGALYRVKIIHLIDETQIDFHPLSTSNISKFTSIPNKQYIEYEQTRLCQVWDMDTDSLADYRDINYRDLIDGEIVQMIDSYVSRSHENFSRNWKYHRVILDQKLCYISAGVLHPMNKV